MKQLSFPNNIQIQTTSRCNAKCSFCPYLTTSRDLPQGTMNDSLFHAIVDEISRYPVDLIQPFLMNDPLMDNKILQRLEHIIRKNPRARINITTNGALLRKDVAKELVKLDLDSIHISSNGLTRNVYRKTMGIDSYLVLKNVNYLWDLIRKSKSKTHLIITAILLRSTKEEMFLAREYWRSRGITYFMNPLNNRAGNVELEHYNEMLPFSKVVNQSQLLSYRMLGCPALYSFMGILYSGDLVTCCMDWYRTRILENVRHKSLYHIWHDKPYQEMRYFSDSGRLDELELCRNCGNNRFSIDERALQGFLEKQVESEKCDGDLRILCNLIRAKQEEPDSLKLNLMRQ